MCHQIAVWPQWDFVFKVAAFLASLAAIFGVPFLIYQVRLARTAFRPEQADRTEQFKRHQIEQAESLKRREAEEAEKPKHHRATILTALQVEAETINKAVDQDRIGFDLIGDAH